MPEPRFLQIHTLTPYTAALLNRDDSGLAKRLPYGGTLRTRVSSQCLKRHWRMADDPKKWGPPDPHGLHQIDHATLAVRSRDLVDDRVIGDLRGEFADEVLEALATWFNYAVYGGKDANRPAKRDKQVKTDKRKERQTLLFGEPEIDWLTDQSRVLAQKADGDPDAAFRLGEEWEKKFKDNIKEMRKNGGLPEGLVTALFGRMVTSDPDANITAPLHVAHAFTVHGEEAESDYFTAVDDLAREDETGADTIQETELTSGLFYGYVVVDLPGLVANLGGDRAMAGAVLHNLVHLIAEVSPGAKLSSTAPYGRAALMLVEAGDRQPRSLAEAYRASCPPETGTAVARLSEHLAELDAAYATGETRRVMSLGNADVPGAERGTLAELGAWAGKQPGPLA